MVVIKHQYYLLYETIPMKLLFHFGLILVIYLLFYLTMTITMQSVWLYKMSVIVAALHQSGVPLMNR